MHSGQRERDPHCARGRRTDELHDRNERSVTPEQRRSLRKPSQCPSSHMYRPQLPQVLPPISESADAWRFGFPRSREWSCA
jgi:hypothetical protein